MAVTFMLLMPMMPASHVATGPLAAPSLRAVTRTAVAPTFPGVKVRGPEFHTPITISAALREIATPRAWFRDATVVTALTTAVGSS
jgi:hypothetical protein